MANQLVKDATKHLADYGQIIYVYRHIRTNQVIYSLTRILKENAALRQLPFLGKKTKPPNLRRDQWTPFFTVAFPSGHQGLHAYRQLRELRVRHEHEWTYEDLGAKSRRDLGNRLMNQKANSVADLASILVHHRTLAQRREKAAEQAEQSIRQARWMALQRLETIQKDMKMRRLEAMRNVPSAWKTYLRLQTEESRIKKRLAKPREDMALAKQYHVLNDLRPVASRGPGRVRRRRDLPGMTLRGIKIWWADLLDADFASSWPKDVEHDVMQRVYHGRTRNLPPPVEVLHKEPPALEAQLQAKEDIVLSTNRNLDAHALDPVEEPHVQKVRERLSGSEESEEGNRETTESSMRGGARMEKRNGSRKNKIEAGEGTEGPPKEGRPKEEMTLMKRIILRCRDGIN